MGQIVEIDGADGTFWIGKRTH